MENREILSTSPDVRIRYGKLAGAVGIVANLLLFAVKITVGLLTSGIAIIADSLNNLSDAGSSALTLFGYALSGKPADKEDARRMLTMLCGCGSAVHTGICIGYKGRFATAVETAYVTFDEMTPEEIEDYISTDEPYDKAGGYAVQGRAALYIAGVTGDWYSVVGLPIHAVKTLLDEEFGIRVKDID